MGNVMVIVLTLCVILLLVLVLHLYGVAYAPSPSQDDQLGVSPVRVGENVREYVKRWPLTAAGIYVFARENCVGTRRLQASRTDSRNAPEGWPVIWMNIVIESGKGVNRTIQADRDVVLKPDFEWLVRTPLALFLDRRGTVLRASVVHHPEEWVRFVRTCPVDQRPEATLSRPAPRLRAITEVRDGPSGEA